MVGKTGLADMLFRRTPARATAPVPLGTPLLNIDDEITLAEGSTTNPWTLGHAFEGTQVFGETGSGKTSGSGRLLATAFLKERWQREGESAKSFGGLVLTAKPNDIQDWLGTYKNGKLIQRGFFQEAGRENPVEGEDYIVLDERAEVSFNFLEHEREHGGGFAHTLVSLFLTAVQSGGDKDSHEDAYWTDALRQLLTNAIDLVLMATDGVTLLDILHVVQSAPQSRAEALSAKWQTDESACWRMLTKAQQNVRAQLEDAVARNDAADIRRLRGRERDFEQTADYWLLDFAGLADRTRSVIVSTFTSKATGLTRWPMYDLFCSKTTVDIVKATREGKVVFINLPVKRYAELGRFAQVLIKTVWQRNIERGADQSRPVFLWADEAQFFVTAEDMLFQTTARSAGCATVYLTQNISNYYAVMNGRNSNAAADSLLGNLTTKIFHANADPATNEWAERVIAKSIREMKNKSLHGGGDLTRGKQQSFESIVQVAEFTTLRKGGPANGNLVECFVFQGGRVWQTSQSREAVTLCSIRQPQRAE